MRLINMKELLSYWDISLGLIAIGIGAFLQYKRRIYEKKRDNEILRKGESLFTYSRYMDDRYAHYWNALLIFLGAGFIYNRIKGNIPNIYTLIKDLIVYHF